MLQQFGMENIKLVTEIAMYLPRSYITFLPAKQKDLGGEICVQVQLLDKYNAKFQDPYEFV